MHNEAHFVAQLRTYTDWAARIWNFHARARLADSVTEELVLVLGLGGEAAELLEEVLKLDSDSVVHDNLVKELGDVAYNWARVAQLCGHDTAELLTREMAPLPALGKARAEEALRLAAQLTVAAGSVLEAYKKQLRDGARADDKVEAGLLAFIRAWRLLCHVLMLDPAAVLQLNRQKLDARFAAGTLGGSGNDR